MPRIELEDARLHYDSRGETGSPVLLIMGFGVPGAMWRNQVDAFAPSHRVAWFDNCGAGESEKARLRPHGMRDLARHAVSLLNELQWSDAHVVGVSMGGMIAQELALRYRSRVRSLSLLVTHAGGLRNLLPPARGLALFARGFLGPRSQRVQALQRLIYPTEYLATIDTELIAGALRSDVVNAGSVRDRVGQMAAVVGHNTASRLGALEGLPTVVVKAGKDVLLRPAACHRLHELIPGSRLVELPEAGHAVMHQCAAQLNRELLTHFQNADANLA